MPSSPAQSVEKNSTALALFWLRSAPDLEHELVTQVGEGVHALSQNSQLAVHLQSL